MLRTCPGNVDERYCKCLNLTRADRRSMFGTHSTVTKLPAPFTLLPESACMASQGWRHFNFGVIRPLHSAYKFEFENVNNPGGSDVFSRQPTLRLFKCIQSFFRTFLLEK